ncbi:unnamed protein product [Dovyalis caffra]|uniref:BHLH domain-containing protein n=1 Tax=Dovyalis caffra TaxID=77055 RepID=A0AAV1SS92_9ROSI|nr:unnamed protein product [Dovyalis caffra]
MEDSAFEYQYHTNPLDYSMNDNQTFYHQTPQNLSSASSGTCQVSFESPVKRPKISEPVSTSSSSHILCFDNSNSPPVTFYDLDSTAVPKNEIGCDSNVNYEYGATYFVQGSKKIAPMSRSPSHAIGERKRREKLSQRFIALSAVIPNLKKMDKASVLGDAVKYLKHLQERVKTLEEQSARKTMESVVFVKKTQVCVDDDSSSIDENTDGCCDHPLPEIETRVSDKDVLIRILCEKKKGCLMKILSEIEKFHLNVINSRTLSFGNCTLDVTVVAQMDVNNSVILKDIVKNIRQALL